MWHWKGVCTRTTKSGKQVCAIYVLKRPRGYLEFCRDVKCVLRVPVITYNGSVQLFTGAWLVDWLY